MKRSNLVAKIVKQGVFRGFHGLEGLADADDFWERQEYGTRLYYGSGVEEYLHRGVLRAVVKVLCEEDSE